MSDNSNSEQEIQVDFEVENNLDIQLGTFYQGEGGASALSDLSDVTLTSLENGQILKYNTTSSKWENANESGGGSSTLSGLSDVTITSATQNQVLSYDGSKWINSAAPSGSSTLSGLTDTTISTPTDGQVLKYDGTNSKWVNTDESGNPYTETVLYDTFNTFNQGTYITLSDDADRYDEIRIYFCYYEQADGGYYAHRRVQTIDRTSILWSISQRQLAGTDRGIIDAIGSFEQSATFGTWRIYFSDKTTMNSQKKTAGGWNADKLGIEKIVGITYAAGHGGGNLHTYSTTERIVGTWIDGSNVYEKTIYDAGGTSSDSSVSIAHGITNLGRVISCDASYYDTAAAGAGAIGICPKTDNYSIGISGFTSTDIIVRIPSAYGSRITDLYFVIRYIKSSS